MEIWKKFFGTKTIDEIPGGEGGVISKEGKKMAIYKGKDGTLKVLSAKCTHMGCTVKWNKDDKSWTCPCHGSKFDVEGEVKKGPAKKSLEKIENIVL